MSNIGIVLRKEMTDHLRDRRTLMAALAFALLGPILIFAMLSAIAGRVSEERTIELAVAGGDLAPNLMAHLGARNIEISDADRPDGIPDIKGRDGLLVIPEDITERYASGLTATLLLYVDETSETSVESSRRVRDLIEEFSREIVLSRLITRGVAPPALMPLTVERRNVAPASAGTMQIAKMAIYFFLLAPVFASLSVAVDLTSGERERKSLQPLLAQPVHLHELILGKWLTACFFAALGTVATIGFGFVMLGLSPLAELGIMFHLAPHIALLVILAMLPFALFMAGLQMLVALFAKSYKEAQTYLSMLSMVPLGVAIVPMITGQTSEGWHTYLPIFAQLEVMNDLVAEGAFPAGHFLAGIGGTLVLLVPILWAATRRLGGETVLEGN